MNLRKFAQFAFGILISVVFIWLIASAIPVDDLISALSTVRYGWVAVGVGCFAVGYISRVSRWRLMLGIDNPDLPFYRVGVPFMVSIAANNVLPLRAGDILRAFAFSKWLSVSSSSVLATLVAERLLDLLSLLIALGLASLLLGLGGGAASVLGVGSMGLIGAAVVIAIAFVFPQVMQPLAMWIARPVAGWMGALGARVTGALDNLFATLKKITRSGRTAGLIGWSILAWGAEAMVFFCAALAVPAMTDPQAAWLAMPVGTLSTLLPSSPGYLGTFHYFVIEAAQLLGNPAAAAAAFAVVAHLILWMTATVVGGFCFAFWSLLRVRQ